MKTKYSVGFLFNPSKDAVVLIRKNRPEFQKGLLNGVGGHVEEGESFGAAMSREFYEETGLLVEDWTPVLVLEGEYSEIHVFTAIGDFIKVHTMTDEEVGVYCVDDVMGREDIMPNIAWMIQMCLRRENELYFVQRVAA